MNSEITNDSTLLILDCDPGCDDALAIALILKEQLKRKIDILTVAGNVSVAQTTVNAARVVAACMSKAQITRADRHENVNIYGGCGKSMSGDEPSAASVHGRDGLGDAPNKLIWACGEWKKAKATAQEFQAVINKSIVVDECAVEQYLKLSRCGTEPFDLLVTGPLTNVACALNLMNGKQQDQFWGRCRNAVIMGGSFGSRGNITHSAEFNTFADPIAAQTVLNAFSEHIDRIRNSKTVSDDQKNKRLHFVSLDTTELVAIPLDGEFIEQPGKTSPASRFLLYGLKQYGTFHVFHCRRPKLPVSATGKTVLPQFDANKYIEEQLGGGAGESVLQRFCFLHDPLAAWIIICGLVRRTKLWRSDFVRVDTSMGEGRGRVIICDQKDGKRPSYLPVYGTEVKWLNPLRFNLEMRLEFINQMADLLGIKKQWELEA